MSPGNVVRVPIPRGKSYMRNAGRTESDRLQKVVFQGKSCFMREHLSEFCLGCTIRGAFRGVVRLGRWLTDGFWAILKQFFRAARVREAALGGMEPCPLPVTDVQVRSAWAIIRVSGRGCSHCRKKLSLVFETHRGTDHSFKWVCPFCGSGYVRAIWDDIVLGGDAEPGGSEQRIEFQDGEILFAEDAESRPFQEWLSELSK